MKRTFTLTLVTMLLMSLTALADSQTITISPSTGTMYRGGSTAVTAVGTWCSTWISDSQPTITIQPADGSTTNNMTLTTDGITLAEGNNTSYSYSIIVESGYLITSVSATVVSAEYTPTVTINDDASVTTTSEEQTIEATDINLRTVDLTLSSSTANGKATFTNWTVTVEETELDTDPGIIYSTEDEQHWYYIYSVSTNSYCSGHVWYYDSEAGYVRFAEKQFLSNYLWSFWQDEDGSVAIQNYEGGYMTYYSGNTNYFALQDDINYGYTIAFYEDGAFTITDGGNPCHAQQNGTVLVHWAAASGNASLWNFEEVDVSDADAKMSGTTVVQGKVTTGIGNKNVPMLRSTIVVEGLLGGCNLQGVTGTIVADDLSDVTGVRAYFASNSQELYIDDPDHSFSWREENGTLWAEGTMAEDGTYTITGDTTLLAGTHYLWIALDISDEATEGNTVDATITAYTIDGAETTEASGNPTYAATIFLGESTPVMPNDMGSLYWRIPAITTTADGKRLVLMTDLRGSTNSDLPAHLYVTAQYSDDNGLSWTEPQTVAGTAETGGDYGHGDASLITNRITGDIIAICTSSPYGTGFSSSTPDAPQAWKVLKSTDNGETWSVPVDHTSSLYGTGSPNENWYAGFSGSGAGLQKRDGTLVSPFVNREADDDGNITQNYYSFMSKDGGDTWYVSGVNGCKGSDEPKILERNNGDLALSSRATGYNYYNYTTDDGETWKLSTTSPTRFSTGITGNACNGEYMVWCSTLDGNAQDVVLQTGCYNSSRMNVSIALSTDEGETFGTPKTICPRGSAYSAATVLADGTLGVYYEEEGVYGGYTMRFVRFSLDWASDGEMQFTDDAPYYPIQTNVVYEVPDYQWNTIILPFDAEVPEGLTAYNCLDSTFVYTDEDGEERVAILLEPITGTTLEEQVPYVVYGTAGTYNFQRPLSEWQARELKENCEYPSYALRGAFCNKKVRGDGETVYNNFKNIASRGGVGFNRVTSGSYVTIPAYSASVELSAANELTLHPMDIQTATGIEGVAAAGQATAAKAKDVYDLSGRKVSKATKGVYVIDGHTVLVN